MATLCPIIKSIWLEALRSGDYEQEQDMFFVQDDEPVTYHTPDGEQPLVHVGPYFYLAAEWEETESGYCCLGVLAKQLGWSTEKTSFNFNELELLGITQDQQAELIEMNDDEGRSFEEIADWIEVML